MIKRSTHIPIYETPILHLVITDRDPDAVISELKEEKYDPKEEDPCRAASDYKWPDFWIILHPDKIERRNLAHEIQHITLFIAAEIGIYINLDDRIKVKDKEIVDRNEPIAYLNDWITGWVYNELDSLGLTVTLAPMVSSTMSQKTGHESSPIS